MSGFILIQIVLASSIALYAVLGLRLLYVERRRANARALKRQSEASSYEVEFVRARLSRENSALIALRTPMPEQRAGASAQDTIGIGLSHMIFSANATGEQPDPANDRGLPLDQLARGELKNFAGAVR
jgi:hypothetical protein